MKKSSLAIVLTSGFAMFSMFFGSGNLIFPILIGIESQQSYIYSILGFVITAVCVPFLGLYGIMQYKGDSKHYFSALGKIPAFMLTFFMLALMGPVGIIPRCSTVSYGGVEILFPQISMALFSALFCLLIGILIWNKNKIVEIIGIYLTPIKLGSFIVLIIVGLLLASRTLTPGLTPSVCFADGLTQGYQTMDLVASFFFGSAIYEYIKRNLTQSDDTTNTKVFEKKLMSLGIQASLFGGFLLTLCYIGFVLLGAKYAHLLQNVPKEALLMIVAQDTIGNFAAPFIAVTVGVSCLATSTIVASLFADFLKEEICCNKITRHQAIILTLFISYAISLLGFSEICAFLGAILEWVYPFLIVFALVQIGRYIANQRKINVNA